MRTPFRRRGVLHCAGPFLLAAAAWACCGDGPPAGPRPKTPLTRREPAGGPVDVLWVGRIASSADAAELAAELVRVPGVFRVEPDPARDACRIWCRGGTAGLPLLVEAAARAGHPAAPLVMSRVFLPGAGHKGRLPPIEHALLAQPGVVELEVELEGADGLARIWHRPSLARGDLLAAVSPVSSGASLVQP